ncbi:MAG: metallophosphatase domain-containing protein [Planctomycetota bacterium]|jgi:predicted phosphodiesterase
MSAVRLVCLSDTHDSHRDLTVPDGDILVHAGDFTKRGREREVREFGEWLAELPHEHKLVVPGNHDFLCERDPEHARALLGDVHYLDGTTDAIEAAGLRCWGSPLQPWFHDWAFNRPRGAVLADHWRRAPASLDVLVTHTPPMGCLDRTRHSEAVGCADLARELDRIDPRLHVFGHIHEDRGTLRDSSGRLSVNACNCDLSYRAVHPAVVVRFEDGRAEIERSPREAGR